VYIAVALARTPERRYESFVLEEGAVGDRTVDALKVLIEYAAGADRQMADLGVAHLSRRESDGLTRRGESRVRVLSP
jgi:hypothetical protein